MMIVGDLINGVQRTALTLFIAAFGAYGLAILGIPGGMLMGAALAVALPSMFGVPTTMPNTLRNLVFICVGLSMGANVSQDTLQLLGQWPLTLLALVLELGVIVLLCGLVLRHFFQFDPASAYLSSFPGHLSFIVALTSAGIGNPRSVVIVQSQRVMALTVFAPIGALFVAVENGSAALSQ